MTHITQLFERYYNKTASASERKELMEYIAVNGYAEELAMLEKNAWEGLDFASGTYDVGDADRIFRRILEGNFSTADLKSVAGGLSDSSPVPRIHLLKTAWFRYAAVILLIVGTITLLYQINRPPLAITQNQPTTITPDVQPGGNKAILTLSDGRTIVLDSAANGHLADQAGTGIVKLANGQIAYNLQGSAGGELLWNTMSTPRGGQYRLTLPDGTNVWLNAASSITYPVVFTGAERKVKISGEAYFEVARNVEKTFIVDVDGKSDVQVLGTSFNINSYSGEESIKTTLLEGSVRVNANNKTAVLKPGQQARMAEGISLSDAIDPDRVIAWKNGIFDFNEASLKEVIPQLERWYDIEVRYEGKVPDVQFSGRMNRGVKLSTIINWFSDVGIKTRLEDKILVVL